MSENKCQFYIGDVVRIMPFEDLSDEYIDADRTLYGIDEDLWEDARRLGAYEVSQLHEGGEAVRLKSAMFWWPVWGLKLDRQAAIPVVEDLL